MPRKTLEKMELISENRTGLAACTMRRRRRKDGEKKKKWTTILIATALIFRFLLATFAI
jgi:hypothetical protein